jgi:hypothetical protein
MKDTLRVGFDSKNVKLFRSILSPSFLLRVIKVSKRKLPKTPIRSIFDKQDIKKTPRSKEDEKKIFRPLMERLKAGLDDLEKALELQDRALIMKPFGQLKGLLQSGRPLLSDVVIIRVKNRLKRYQGAFQLIRFQSRQSLGIAILKAMETSLRNKNFDDVIGQSGHMTAIIEDLRPEDDESSQTLAEVLEKKAFTFKAKAERKNRIAELSLFVTGIILDHRQVDSGSRNSHRAIINNKIYKAGDQVTDKQGEPIKALRIVEIEEGTVKFQFEDEDFIRVLQTR